MSPTDRVLALDMKNLTQEDVIYLHKLKNLAIVMQARIMLKHMKEEGSFMDDDKYGSVYRENMKHSMEYPANRRPRLRLIRPMNMDRRKRWLRRIWWHWSEALGGFLWLFAGTLAAALLWIAYGGFRK